MKARNKSRPKEQGTFFFASRKRQPDKKPTAGGARLVIKTDRILEVRLAFWLSAPLNAKSGYNSAMRTKCLVF